MISVLDEIEPTDLPNAVNGLQYIYNLQRVDAGKKILLEVAKKIALKPSPLISALELDGGKSLKISEMLPQLVPLEQLQAIRRPIQLSLGQIITNISTKLYSAIINSNIIQTIYLNNICEQIYEKEKNVILSLNNVINYNFSAYKYLKQNEVMGTKFLISFALEELAKAYIIISEKMEIEKLYHINSKTQLEALAGMPQNKQHLPMIRQLIGELNALLQKFPEIINKKYQKGLKFYNMFYDIRNSYLEDVLGATPPFHTNLIHNGKIYALSDIHGDLHAFITVLRDCAKVIRKSNYDYTKIDPAIETNLIANIENDDIRFDETFGYEWCGENAYIVICGDIIDPARYGFNNCKREPQNDCTDYPQIEIKLLRFINAINKQATKDGGRIFKLLGNHEFHNIKTNSSEQFTNYRFDTPSHTYRGTSRAELFHYKKPGYNLLFEDGCYALLKINNTIFAHGELPLAGTLEQIEVINTAINNTDILQHSIGIFDWLESRNWAYPSMVTTRNVYNTQDDFCNNTIKERLRKFLGTQNVDNYRVVLGHCIQSAYDNSICELVINNDTNILDSNGVQNIIPCHATTFNNVNSSDTTTITYDGTTIYSNNNIDADISAGHINNIYGITMQCKKPIQAVPVAINTPADFFIYHVDIGSSRAFDNISDYKQISLNTMEKENKYLFSRTPQVLLIDNNEGIENVKIIKSKMKNTRIHQPRPNYETYVEELNRDFKQQNPLAEHELSLANDRYLKKYLKYKAKYMNLHKKLST